MKSKKYKVYQLLLNGVVVYVGHTNDIELRVLQHKRSGRNFNSHKIVKSFTIKLDALNLERKLCKKYFPKPTTKLINSKLSEEAIQLWHKFGVDNKLNKEKALAELIIRGTK